MAGLKLLLSFGASILYYFVLKNTYNAEFAGLMLLGLCVSNMWAAFIAEKPEK